MKNLPEIITAVCAESHIPMIEAVFGAQGVAAAYQIMKTIKEFFVHIDPERIDGSVVIFRIIAETDNTQVTQPISPSADFAALANALFSNIVLEVCADGRSYHRDMNDRTPEEIASNAVVYHYQNGQERFLAKSESKNVLKLDSSARSQFSVPTFSSLREALQCYARENVRESTCYIFNNVWYDINRLFLLAGPESKMRDSLLQFLRNRLGGDHDVWPEQNVDESHPVDIQLQPKFSNNRLMLIEIKWLGDSVAPDGHITVRHREPRALSGVNQLTQYIEDKRRFAPSNVIQGYYVIIDARRRRLRAGAKTISRSDGMHYETKEITFNPMPHEVRSDFDPPYRMFARPVCCD